MAASGVLIFRRRWEWWRETRLIFFFFDAIAQCDNCCEEQCKERYTRLRDQRTAVQTVQFPASCRQLPSLVAQWEETAQMRVVVHGLDVVETRHGIKKCGVAAIVRAQPPLVSFYAHGRQSGR